MLLFLLLFPISTFLGQNLLFIVCAQTPNPPMLTVVIAFSCNKSSPHHIPVALQHISLLCFLHSSSTTWLSRQNWLLLWPIKCYFMGRRISRSWRTLQSSDPRSKEGFSIYQYNQWVRNASGLQLLGSGAGTGEIPACTSLVLAFSWPFHQSLPSNRFSN